MKFGIGGANVGPFVDPERLAHMAQAAEAVGIESLWTVEHVVVPVGYTAEYPYHKSGKIPGPEHVPIPDPILPLAFVAGLTKKLKLATGVLILPQRHPTYVAKDFATLDQLSQGRAILGVGIGWLHEEFATVDVPFKERAGRTEESIRAIRSLWKAEPEAFKGEYYRWEAVQSNPKPVQPGGVPIVVGGHVEGAARRAARLGDGFFPAKGDLPVLLKALRDECDRIGRDPSEIEITSFGAPDLDGLKKLQELGVSRAFVNVSGSRDDVERKLEEIGNDLIAKL